MASTSDQRHRLRVVEAKKFDVTYTTGDEIRPVVILSARTGCRAKPYSSITTRQQQKLDHKEAHEIE